MPTIQVPIPTPALPTCSGANSFAITPDDDTPFKTCSLKLYVGVTGDVTAVMAKAPMTETPETWSPTLSDTTSGILSNGNLTYATTTGTWPLGKSQDKIESSTGDKFYAEFTVENSTSGGGQQLAVGLVTSGWTTGNLIGQSTVASNHSIAIFDNTAGIYVSYDNTNIDFTDGSGSFANGDVIGIAVDLTGQTIKWYQNGTLLHTTNLASISLNNLDWYFAVSIQDKGTSPSCTCNFSAPVNVPAGYGLLSHFVAATTLFKAMAVGMYDLALAQVMKTGTTASQLVGLY